MQRIYDTIQNYHMIEPGMRVLAGVSGGADSVCLLLALAEYRRLIGFELVAVHVEHGIRGEESLADARYVEKLCRSFGVELVVEHPDVAGLAQERHMTMEEAGRAARYEIFERIRLERGADRIAVAHNQNDQAETVLWNLVRGSGIAGLAGMSPVRNHLVRPLLFLSRAEIEKILRSRGIGWQTDRTNLETCYTRNRIRLQVLPQMEQQLNAQAVRHLAEASERLREVCEYLSKETDRAAARCILPGVYLDLQEFCREQPLIQKELLKRCVSLAHGGAGGLKDLGHLHLEALLSLAGMPCGKSLDLPGKLQVIRERQFLHFIAQEKSERFGSAAQAEVSGMSHHTGKASCAGRSPEKSAALEIPVTVDSPFRVGGFSVRAELLDNSAEILQEIHEEKKYTKLLSYDTINYHVCFRTRRTGDYLIINQDGGRKKLKDYLIDQKIPRQERDRLWLLADGSHILWIVGDRISEAAKVKQDTKQILKIQLEEDGNK